jgi:hypothetical protein
VGLDRSPELGTLRRKVRTLARQNKALAFMEALARRHLAPQPEIWAYVDSHVAVYTGKRKPREHQTWSSARPSLPTA